MYFDIELLVIFVTTLLLLQNIKAAKVKGFILLVSVTTELLEINPDFCQKKPRNTQIILC